MKLKRIIAGIAALVMVAGITASAAQTIETISVNGINVVVNDEPYTGINLLYKDRTYVPLRDIAENIGCTVDWDGATSTATITSRGAVQFAESLVENFGAYDEAYAALKVEYDRLIAYQNTLAAETTDPKEKADAEAEAVRLAAEFETKAAAIKVDYDVKQQTKPVGVAQQLPVSLNSINIIVNGKAITEPNILYQDRTYVPFRAIFEALGCVVGWNGDTQTASISGFFNEGILADDVFTSFEQEYAEVKAKYEKLIAEQETLAKQIYDDTMKQSSAATGGQVGAQTQLAEAAAAPYYQRAEGLREDLKKEEARLKVKYGVTE